MSGRWSALVALAVGAGSAIGGAAAAPGTTPLDQPDLDGGTAVRAVLDVQRVTTSAYDPAVVAPILTVAATAQVGPVTLGAQLPTLLVIYVGDVTASAQYARPVTACVVAGLGAAWTVPSTTIAKAGGLAHALPRDAHRFFDRGHVAQLHGDVRWQAGDLTVQGQLGVDDYLIADWRDQLLLRAALAATVAVAPRWWLTVEGTALSDVIDEEWDEGADLVGSASLAVRTRVRSGVVGVHGVGHHSVADGVVPADTWALGVDAAFPVEGW